ncbi:hypothetical protein OQA88_9138 [Cercophora sp. LCS_1]
MPRFLEFPPEIIHLILVEAIAVRGVARGLRLKLVCKRFYDAVNPALFETKLLDNHVGFGLSEESAWTWPIDNRPEADPTVGRYVAIRQVVEAVCSEAAADYDTALEALCWVRLARGTYKAGEQQPEAIIKPIDLLAAAAYLNHIPLAKRLLSEGYHPTSLGLFPPAVELAAFGGHADMLKLFQGYLPEKTQFGRALGRNKPGLGALIGAVLRGDMEIVKLALALVYSPGTTTTATHTGVDTSNGSSQKPTHDDMLSSLDLPQSNSMLRKHLRKAIGMTKNWEVYQYLRSLAVE